MLDGERCMRWIVRTVIALFFVITALAAHGDPGTGAAAEGGAAKADTASGEVDWFPRSPLDWEKLTGNWGGARTRLADHGITVDGLYLGQVFTNLNGGYREGTEYNGLFDLTLDFNTEKLGLWPGGMMRALLENTHGNSPSAERVGDRQLVSWIDVPDYTHLSELFYEQKLLRDAVRIRIGKQDVNKDFYSYAATVDFCNSSFTLMPNIPQPTFPNPGLGVAAHVDPAEWFTIGAGMYDGAPNGATSGWHTTFDGKDGHFFIGEMGLKPTLKAGDRGLPGDFRVGGWYHSGTFDVMGKDGDTVGGNYGFYTTLNQMVFKEKADKDDSQGLSLFLQVSWAEPSRAELDLYTGCGLSYKGLIPGRDSDSFGLGLASVRYSGNVEGVGGRSEATVETFYKIQITRWCFVEPDFQFVFHPSATYPDAAVIGLAFGLTF